MNIQLEAEEEPSAKRSKMFNDDIFKNDENDIQVLSNKDLVQG